MEADCGGEEGFLATPEKRWTGDCRLQSAAKRPRIAGSDDHDNEVQGALCDWWPILAQRMGPGVLTILKEVFSQGFCLSTDYSGFGFLEVALANLAESLGADTSAVTCYRASDINVTCRRALLSRHSTPHIAPRPRPHAPAPGLAHARTALQGPLCRHTWISELGIYGLLPI